MKYDGGVFTKNGKRELSSIYRFLSRNPPRIETWPEHILKDIGVFVVTPGISWRWCLHNFNISDLRLTNIRKYSKQWHHLAMENMLSGTKEDAQLYMKFAPKVNRHIPMWVRPFILDDIKSGMRQYQVAAKWNITAQTVINLSRGVIGNVFHSGLQRRFG